MHSTEMPKKEKGEARGKREKKGAMGKSVTGLFT